MPYRVFLADSIYLDRGWGKTLYNYRVNGNALIIGGMNEDLTAMDAVTKRTRKNELLGAMWDYYIAQGLLNAPDEFYKDTDYENAPALPLDGENLEAYRKRGFYRHLIVIPERRKSGIGGNTRGLKRKKTI